MRIDELTTEAEWREAFPVMRELRPHLNEVTFLDIMRAMKPQGYRLLAARADAHRFYENKVGMTRTAYTFQKAVRPSIFTWPPAPPSPPTES